MQITENLNFILILSTYLKWDKFSLGLYTIRIKEKGQVLEEVNTPSGE